MYASTRVRARSIMCSRNNPKLLWPAEPASDKPDPAAALHRRASRPSQPGPQIGAALLQRQSTSKLPWVLVATLGVAVVSLLAYIVMT